MMSFKHQPVSRRLARIQSVATALVGLLAAGASACSGGAEPPENPLDGVREEHREVALQGFIKQGGRLTKLSIAPASVIVGDGRASLRTPSESDAERARLLFPGWQPTAQLENGAGASASDPSTQRTMSRVVMPGVKGDSESMEWTASGENGQRLLGFTVALACGAATNPLVRHHMAMSPYDSLVSPHLYVFDRPASCDHLLAFQETALCMAEKFASIADAVDTLHFPVEFGDGDSPTTVEIIFPPQSMEDRFIARDLALNALAAVAELDLAKPFGGDDLELTDEAMMERTHGATTCTGAWGIVYRRAELLHTAGPVHFSDDSYFPDELEDATGADPDRKAAEARLAVKAHVLRAASRLTEKLVRDGVREDLAIAEQRRAQAGSPLVGAVRALGLTDLRLSRETTEDGNFPPRELNSARDPGLSVQSQALTLAADKYFDLFPVQAGEPAPASYGSMNHAAKTLLGRLEIGLGQPDPSYSGVPSTLLFSPNVMGSDLIASVVLDAPVQTGSQGAALTLMAGAGIVIPRLALDQAAPGALRVAIEDQFALNEALRLSVEPTEVAANGFDANAKRLLSAPDGQRPHRVSDEDLRFALEKTLSKYTVLLGSTPALGDPIAEKYLQIPAKYVAASLTKLGGLVILPTVLGTAEACSEASLAKLEAAGAASDASIPQFAGKTAGASFKDVFSLGTALASQLTAVRDIFPDTGDPSPTWQVANVAVAEARWAVQASVHVEVTMPQATGGQLAVAVSLAGAQPRDFGAQSPDELARGLSVAVGSPTLGLVFGSDKAGNHGASLVSDGLIAQPTSTEVAVDGAAAYGLDGAVVKAGFTLTPSSVMMHALRGAAPPGLHPTDTPGQGGAAGAAGAGSGSSAGSQPTQLVWVRQGATTLGTFDVSQVAPGAKAYFSVPWSPTRQQLLAGLLCGQKPGAPESTSTTANQSTAEQSWFAVKGRVLSEAPSYCVEGVSKTPIVPLENELTSDSDGYENSWRHYLNLAKSSAAEADRLGEELIRQGLQADLRNEAGMEAVADHCGAYVPSTELEVHKGDIANSGSNGVLKACLQDDAVDIVFLAGDPAGSRDGNYDRNGDGHLTVEDTVDLLQKGNASDQELQQRLRQQIGCPILPDCASKTEAECQAKILADSKPTSNLDCHSGRPLTHEALGLVPAAPPSPDPGLDGRKMHELVGSMSNPTTGLQASLMRDLATREWATGQNIQAWLDQSYLDVDKAGEWTLRVKSRLVMSSAPPKEGETPYWPGCLASPGAINGENACPDTELNRAFMRAFFAVDAMQGVVDSTTKDIHVNRFVPGTYNDPAKRLVDRDRILWQLEGALWKLASVAGKAPKGLYGGYLPVVDFTLADGTATAPALAIYTPSKFIVLGSGNTKTVSDTLDTAPELASQMGAALKRGKDEHWLDYSGVSDMDQRRHLGMPPWLAPPRAPTAQDKRVWRLTYAQSAETSFLPRDSAFVGKLCAGAADAAKCEEALGSRIWQSAAMQRAGWTCGRPEEPWKAAGACSKWKARNEELAGNYSDRLTGEPVLSWADGRGRGIRLGTWGEVYLDHYDDHLSVIAHDFGEYARPDGVSSGGYRWLRPWPGSPRDVVILKELHVRPVEETFGVFTGGQFGFRSHESRDVRRALTESEKAALWYEVWYALGALKLSTTELDSGSTLTVEDLTPKGSWPEAGDMPCGATLATRTATGMEELPASCVSGRDSQWTWKVQQELTNRVWAAGQKVLGTTCSEYSTWAPEQEKKDCWRDLSLSVVHSIGSWAGAELSPERATPSQRMRAFVNSYGQANSEEAWETLQAFMLAYLFGDPRAAVIPLGQPPVIASLDEIGNATAYVNTIAGQAASAVRALYVDHVPRWVLEDHRAKRVGDGGRRGVQGGLGLKVLQQLQGLVDGWQSVEHELTQLSSAIEAVQLAVTRADLQNQSANNQVYKAQQELTIRRIHTSLQAAQAVASFISSCTPTLNFPGVSFNPGACGASAALAGYTVEKTIEENNALDNLGNAEDIDAQIAAAVHANDVATALNSFGDTMQATFVNVSRALSAIRTGTAEAMSASRQIADSQQKARYQALKGAGADYVRGDDGRAVALPVNTVNRRFYDVTRRRYERALRNARYFALLARGAIEQRLGRRLAGITEMVGGLDAPSTWVEDVCSMTGIDYARLRDCALGSGEAAGSGGTGAGGGDAGSEGGDAYDSGADANSECVGDADVIADFADSYVGDYVTKLEQFVEYYNVQYPSHDGDDTAVLSLREDLLLGEGSCRVDSPNLLYYSADLRGLSGPVSEVDENGVEQPVDASELIGWRKTDCDKTRGKCLEVLGAGSMLSMAGAKELSGKLANATDAEKRVLLAGKGGLEPPVLSTGPGIAWLREIAWEEPLAGLGALGASGSGGVAGSGGAAGSDAGGAAGSGGVAGSGAGGAAGAAGSGDEEEAEAPAPALPLASLYQEIELDAGRYVLSWWDQARTDQGGPWTSMDSSTGTPEYYRVELYDEELLPVDDAFVLVRPHVEQGDVGGWSPRRSLVLDVSRAGRYTLVFGAAQSGLESRGSVALGNVQLERASASEEPTAYVGTMRQRFEVVSPCPMSTVRGLQDAFVRVTDESGTYWELQQPIDVETLQLAKSSPSARLRGRLAAGNFNYRHVDLAVNLVGTGVQDCSKSTSASCYGTGYIEYSLSHNATDVPVVSWGGGDEWGAERFSFGTSSIHHGKALAAERYITLPIGGTDQSLLSQPAFRKQELRGRPLDGSYRLRIWDNPNLRWERLQDVQLVINYRYWSAVE